MENNQLIVIGGGLAGSEAAWQAAQRGIKVKLYEMRPKMETGAHETEYLAELVCSNSLGSNLPDRASGLLKEELRILGSLLISIAENTAVPAGGALAVDRNEFAKQVSLELENHSNITIIREEYPSIPDGPAIISSGPLTSSNLSTAILELSGEEHLYFFDAISPIVQFDSIDLDKAYRASRYERGVQEMGDYINCPMDEEEYEHFIDELQAAERIELKDFEKVIDSGVKAGAHIFFEGCLPVEIIAARGKKSLAFGPMRPVGLNDPKTGKRPYAVLQLRQDNLSGSMFNMVGFQTNLKFAEQRRIFRMIPGLEKAQFLRYGQMHRNTFIFSPRLMRPTFQYHDRDDLYFAGQITGIEGYVGNIASGLLAGWNAYRQMAGESQLVLPKETMLGALCYYITNADEKDFQPMKSNFGIVPPLTDNIRRNKRQRAAAYSERSIKALKGYLEMNAIAPVVS